MMGTQEAETEGVNKQRTEQILDWTVKICMALKHLHDQQILHKNLQPKSLFFTACGTIRLGEFGVIHEWSSGAQITNPEALSYIAPEILKGEPYDEKSEIWNLGCIIYEMCMLKCAFAGRSTIDIIPKILNGSYEVLPTNFSEDLRQLVKDTLQIDPANRPSVSEILMRPFIIRHLYEMSTKTVKELIVCKKKKEIPSESEDNQEAPNEPKVCLKVLEELADGLERVHFNTTVGSLAGGVVGLAGGITSIVGLILTPFTLGASLIVTGVGIGVAVAGGVASGMSNLIKMANERSDRQKKKLPPQSTAFKNIQIAVETQRLLSESNESWLNAESGKETLISAGARLGRGLGGVAELVRLVQVTGAGRIAAQTARVVRVAEVATGVLTGLFVAVDIFFIALDSIEIHKLRRDSASTNRNEQELRSEIMKFSNIIERRRLHANSLSGIPPDISERYSKDLRKLIKKMLSHDPHERPSADEILAKPFLSEAVNGNKRIPEKLQRRFMRSLKTFDESYNAHHENFKALVKEWGETTDSLESLHYKTTAGSLSGAVIGAAGGVTALVGAILAPFTFGASLIVSGVGIGVGVGGGVTGAASNITNTVKQKSIREKLQNIQQEFNNASTPILKSLSKLRRLMRKLTVFRDFARASTIDNVQTSWRLGRSSAVGVVEFVTLGMLANFGRIAVQSASVGRAVAAASGVLSGILVIADVAFIVKDSREIHQMRQHWQTDDPEKVKSDVLKSIANMRKTHKDLCNVLKEIEKTKNELNEHIENARQYFQESF
ncbi:Serine/threonine-protein kinase Nek1 [Labeo rohita]|uniref:Serine/threonine-protein kinase Nek1 n=1 Tax=Labeo rohita TaxID=84645 RepID=A0ABQ8L9A2_LABRO|nr:Serine/threonine-protein kinase Nek1 [Labeo rohita]